MHFFFDLGRDFPNAEQVPGTVIGARDDVSRGVKPSTTLKNLLKISSSCWYPYLYAGAGILGRV